MLRGEEVREIQEMYRQGASIRAISEALHCDRKTVRRYLETPERVPTYGPRPPRGSKLDPFLPYLDRRLREGVWNAQVLLRELRQQGYTGGYTLVKDYLQPQRRAARAGAVRRFETPPGRQAQVDWGDLGHEEGPEGRLKLYAFVLTLGYSRAMFVDLAADQQLGTLLALHEAGFAALGGVPQEILYDRMKTVVLGVDERDEVRWHPVFRDFARYWGFTPRLCRAYRPQTKGKVESGVRYLRQSFLCGRTAASREDLRQQLRTWLTEVAFPRVHGTTHRVVREAWEEERPYLQPARQPPFPYAPELTRQVSRDAYVSYQGNRYSVPFALAGRTVTLRRVGGTLELWSDGARQACHALLEGKHQTRTVPEHHAPATLSIPERPGGKARLTLRVGDPEVEVRPLDAYERLAGGPV